jgi:hypothetical protein
MVHPKRAPRSLLGGVFSRILGDDVDRHECTTIKTRSCRPRTDRAAVYRVIFRCAVVAQPEAFATFLFGSGQAPHAVGI